MAPRRARSAKEPPISWSTSRGHAAPIAHALRVPRQSQDGAGARHQPSADLDRPRRRGDRMIACGTSRTSENARLESAKWAKADIDQVAVTNRDFMSTRPKTKGS